jgi:hypothetical protein
MTTGHHLRLSDPLTIQRRYIMKKTILIVLMVVMIATPCLAQEIEPDGLLTIEKTYWESVLDMMIFPIPHPGPPSEWVGFSGGVVYHSRFPQGSVTMNSFYIDMVIASIFMYNATDNQDTETTWKEVGIGILQPLSRIGVQTIVQTYQSRGVTVVMSLLNKTDDNWTPPSE